MPDISVTPLDGVRVLELGNFIAAPTAGRLLADFGAEVIKVERPRTGDELRTWRLYAGSTSLLYRTINRHKKSIALDLSTAEGRAAVLELVARCDVVLENFRPGTLERWGLGPEKLERANPDIVVTRISAFGQTGPWSHRAGFAAVAEAHSGFRELVGDADRPPVRVGVSIGDSIAGLYAAFGTLMVLFDRNNRMTDGRPRTSLQARTVDVALNEAMLSMMESLVPDHEAYAVVRERIGGRMQGIAPSNAYLCSDGSSVVIAGNGDAIFLRLMDLIGRPDLGQDPDLRDNAHRWARRDELDAAIGAWTSALPSAQVLEDLDRASVPSGRINTASDIAADPQYAARDMIQRLDVDNGDEVIENVGFPGIVPVFGERSQPIRSLGPDLGEHTFEVLRFLAGWSEERIFRMLDAQMAEAS